jgi:hypothetical protein
MPKVSSKKKNKSAFIRNLPSTLSAAEVVAKAKAAGITFDDKYVYRIRSLARGKKKSASKPGLAKATSAAASNGSTKPVTSKAAFVRSLPATIPAKAVVAQAKAAGLNLSAAYVYIVRAAAKENRGSTRAGRSIPRPITTSSSAESLLRALGAELGLGRAIEVLEGEREKVLAVLG